MAWFQAIIREVLGLFVDDSGFALAILAWIAVSVALSWLGIASAWVGITLFAGLAVILLESAVRRSRS